MRIRRYTERDLEALQRMHARQGFSYEFPDLEDELFLEKVVLEDEEGALERGEAPGEGRSPRIVMAALLRLTAEAYFLHEPEAGKPAERFSRFLLLHEAVREQAVQRGLADVYCWLPPEVPPRTPLGQKKKPRGFERKLEQLGWQSNRWRCYWRGTKEPT